MPDNESNAKGRSLTVGGHNVYALYMIPQDGYRNNAATGMPTGTAAQGVYEVADGKRGGPACCWDFGNASTNNCNGPSGQMDAIFFGTGYWGKGAGGGPWFLGDFENGVWSGGTGASNTTNANDPSMGVNYAMGVLKSNSSTYAIMAGDATTGTLTKAYDGALPFNSWTMKGGIVLGIGGDNSNSSYGTFFEGAITSGKPSDTTDESVHANVIAAGYGK
jgi:non-reducing end alpha-L-arabinofuranosidase